MVDSADFPGADARPQSDQTVSEPIARNIADILALENKELEQTTAAQRRLEALSRKMARPGYLVGLIAFVVVWIAFNLHPVRGAAFDPVPFPWLQGVMTLTAMLTATIVLIGQARQSKLAEQRAHLDLQVNLLTEQKVTKLIHLLEELRTDLPGVRARHDPHVSELKRPTDAKQLASALKATDPTSAASEPPRPSD